ATAVITLGRDWLGRVTAVPLLAAASFTTTKAPTRLPVVASRITSAAPTGVTPSVTSVRTAAAPTLRIVPCANSITACPLVVVFPRAGVFPQIDTRLARRRLP